MLAELSSVGPDRRRGGYSRHGFDDADLALREWFVERAGRAGLSVETDRNGNLWAWWGAPGPGAVVTGSHLDSVPGGGAFDGPLGVLSALEAVSALRHRGFAPRRPLAVVVFAEEEGSRFGVPCLGSRLLTGALNPSTAARLSDVDGVTLAEAVRRAGLDPARLGPDPVGLARIGTFVELHVEQGRTLAGPVGIGSTILAHGRWRVTVDGRADHPGTTSVDDRRDPMLAAAALVLTARRVALAGPALATVGRLVPVPGGTNVIASRVSAWLDVRAPSAPLTRDAVGSIVEVARTVAEEEGCRLELAEESFSEAAMFDPDLGASLAGLLGGAPRIRTGAGHDAGVLAAHVPTAMLFVRNPTGVSHSPEEHAEDADCAAGVAALTLVLQHLAG